MTQCNVVSWNVNSIRSRLSHLLDWLKIHRPDIVMLQEIKVTEENFPFQEIEDLGYNAAVWGQKTYNGVAILSKRPFDEVIKDFPNNPLPQARFIETVIEGRRYINLYAPNGGEIDSEKYHQKLAFYDCLTVHLQTYIKLQEDLIIGGDFNIAPEEIDVYDPKVFDHQTLFSFKEKEAFRKLIHMGLYDAYRGHHPDKGIYTWWDYRKGAWVKNHGCRIDHFLLSASMMDRLNEVHIDTSVRGKEKASDHAPIWMFFT